MLNSDVLYNITLFWETGCYTQSHLKLHPKHQFTKIKFFSLGNSQRRVICSLGEQHSIAHEAGKSCSLRRAMKVSLARRES